MADITKIQPIGDSTQYELGARYLTTARTLTIGNTGKTFNGTANVSWTTTEILGSSDATKFYRGDKTWSNALNGSLHLYGTTIGNTASDMISGTAGLFSWGDTGPKITFDTSATPGGGQAGALIFTDHDSAGPGVSFNFVSNQSNDCSVNSNRFNARSTISIGTNTPQTSYNLYCNGASCFTGQVNITSGSVLQIDHRNVSRASNTMYDAARLYFKNASNSTDYGVSWLRYLGTSSTDGYSTTICLGSNNGGTWITAGESGSTMPTKLSTYDSETLYMCADNDMNFYVGCANDASSYVRALNIEAQGGMTNYASNYSGGYVYNRINSNNKIFGIHLGSGGVNRGLYDWTAGNWILYCDGTNARSGMKLYGAVWNDYAEFRQTHTKIEPGRCIKEIGDDTLELTTKRLQKGCEIVSDTFGFAIGESDIAKTPTAVSGRVLAYLYEDREIAKQHIGDPVCSGPNGTVSIMTEEEESKYPSRIIGTISAVPDYEIWHAGSKTDEGITNIDIKVNGRVWIRVR